MTPEQFCYWLQGYFEIGHIDTDMMNATQIQVVKEHLNLVFQKVTPDRVGIVGIPAYKTPQPAYCDASYDKLFTAHTGITTRGLC